MKKATCESDNYEPLPEYDLTKLGPGVIGKYAHLRKQISPEQIQEEVRLVARREVNIQMNEVRKELDLMKKQLDRIEQVGRQTVPTKGQKKLRPALEKKSA